MEYNWMQCIFLRKFVLCKNTLRSLTKRRMALCQVRSLRRESSVSGTLVSLSGGIWEACCARAIITKQYDLLLDEPDNGCALVAARPNFVLLRLTWRKIPFRGSDRFISYRYHGSILAEECE
jgi:hypothetical protein